jgi:hypothetical protein
MKLNPLAKVGLFTLIALVALASIIIWKNDIFLVSRGYQMIGSFKSIEGLTLGSEVRYRGFSIGKVMRIDPNPQDIRLYATINKEIKFPADSALRIAYDGLVGQKYLEIQPGTAEAIYQSGNILFGVTTSGIVDFVDLGAQNLVETKRILENVRIIIENPRLQAAFMNAVFTAEKAANEIEALTKELRTTNQGIMAITNDPKFQQNVKGTISETEKTLSSANRFFESAGQLNLRLSGGVDIGRLSNAVRGDVDILQSDKNYLRLGVGEGPTRQLSLLDVVVTSKVSPQFGYRLGLINSQLGGGLIFNTSDIATVLADIYDINNPKPNNPKIRLGYEHEIQAYMDLLLQADDLINAGDRNFLIGIRVKPAGENLF